MPDEGKTRTEQAKEKQSGASPSEPKQEPTAEQQEAAKMAQEEAEVQQAADAERAALIEAEVQKRMKNLLAEMQSVREEPVDRDPAFSETQKGGIYRTAKGKFVDANGREVKPGEPNGPMTKEIA